MNIHPPAPLFGKRGVDRRSLDGEFDQKQVGMNSP